MEIPGFKGADAKRVGKSLFKELSRDAVTDSAALLSYYVLFAIFPFLFFLITLTAYLPIHQATHDLISRLHSVMPGQAFSLISDHIQYLTTHRQPHLLTVTLLSSLWTASRAVDAFRKSMNLAYDVPESRSAVKTNAMALAMTVLGGALVLLSLTMIAAGGRAGLWLADRVRLGRLYVDVWTWLRWPSTALVVMLAVAIAFYVLPDVEQRFKFITPGSVLATLAWLLATWAFGIYTDHFGNYNATYGSIGGVILLMSWLYASGLVFIGGGELNAVIEGESADGKILGARHPGEPPPPEHLRPSAVPPGASKSAAVAGDAGQPAAGGKGSRDLAKRRRRAARIGRVELWPPAPTPAPPFFRFWKKPTPEQIEAARRGQPE